jgi:hypothetical protein
MIGPLEWRPLSEWAQRDIQWMDLETEMMDKVRRSNTVGQCVRLKSEKTPFDSEGRHHVRV